MAWETAEDVRNFTHVKRVYSPSLRNTKYSRRCLSTSLQGNSTATLNQSLETKLLP